MSAVETKTALIALQGMRSASADMAKATERLATGKRINQAADDPAGNAQAVRLKADIASYDMVKRGLGQMNSELGQLSSSLNQVSDFLVEMRSLALLTATETNATLKTNFQSSFAQLAANLKDVVDTTTIAGTAVFAGEVSASVTAQTGIAASGSSKTLTFGGLSTSGSGALAAVAGLDISTTATAASLSAIDTAIAAVSTEVAKVGGYQNSIQFASDYVDSTILNKSIQLSQVMDADFAQEATNLAAARIRQDASTAVLAQANSMSRTVADFLLKGAMG